MDSLVNQLAREITDAIAAVVATDPRIEACREKARAAGLETRVSLETAVSFIDRSEAGQAKAASRRLAPRAPAEMSANDRRFLKSLRISADEAAEKEAE